MFKFLTLSMIANADNADGNLRQVRCGVQQFQVVFSLDCGGAQIAPYLWEPFIKYGSGLAIVDPNLRFRLKIAKLLAHGQLRYLHQTA